MPATARAEQRLDHEAYAEAVRVSLAAVGERDPAAHGLEPLPPLELRTRVPGPRDVRTTGLCPADELARCFERVAFVGSEGCGRTHLIGRLVAERLGERVVPVPLALRPGRDAGLHAASDPDGLLRRFPGLTEPVDSGAALVLVDMSEGEDPAAAAVAAALVERWPSARFVVAAPAGCARELAELGFHVAALERPTVADVAGATGVGEDEVAAGGLLVPWEAAWAHAIHRGGGRWPRGGYELGREVGRIARSGTDPLLPSFSRALAATEEALAAARRGTAAEAVAALAPLAARADDLARAAAMAAEGLGERAGEFAPAAVALAERAVRRDPAAGLAAPVALAAHTVRGTGAGTADRLAHLLAGRLDREAASISAGLRIQLGELVALLPDPRIAAEPDLLPVPGGRLLARHPVTVSQFARFVRAAGHRAPDDWVAQLEHPSRPVTGVDWHDAVAYARWLALHTGRPYRLQRSATWAAAATAAGGDHPWGAAAPTAERLNFEQNVGTCTPVLAYPAGAGPHGHLDLAGNVWEWCHDGGDDGRIVRGGGWYTKAAYTRSDYEFPFHRLNRFHDLGFRVESAPEREP